MTLEEAKISDRILNAAYMNMKILKNPNFGSATIDLDFIDKEEGEHIGYRLDQYIALFKFDGLLKHADKIAHDYFPYNLSTKGEAFLLFKGGYTKILKDEIEAENEKIKNRNKDLTINIILAAVAVLSLIFTIV